MNESKQKLDEIILTLQEDPRLSQLVSIVEPADLVAIIVNKLDVLPKDAQQAVDNLISKNEKNGMPSLEGLMWPSMTDYEYPLPADKRRVKKTKAYRDEDGVLTFEFIARPQGKMDITPKFDFKRHHFPPDPVEEPGEWPYDDMTTKGMEPKNKTKKKSLSPSFIEGKRRSYTSPGGDSSGTGLQMKFKVHNKSNSTPTSGTSFDIKGTDGWSRASDEFDKPEVIKKVYGKVKENIKKKRKKYKKKDYIDFFGNSPVGSHIVRIGGAKYPSSLRKGFKKN